MKAKSTGSPAGQVKKRNSTDHSIQPNAAEEPDMVQLRNAGYTSLSFYKSIRALTRFRLAWLHHYHPEWNLKAILSDMMAWYSKDLPNAVRADMRQFISAEWKKGTFKKIDAPSFNVLFGSKSAA